MDSQFTGNPLTASLSANLNLSSRVLWLTMSALSSGSEKKAGPPPKTFGGDARESARASWMRNLVVMPVASDAAAMVPRMAAGRERLRIRVVIFFFSLYLFGRALALRNRKAILRRADRPYIDGTRLGRKTCRDGVALSIYS